MAPSYIISKDDKRQIAVASDSEARDRARGSLVISSAQRCGAVVESPADPVAWVRAQRAVPTVAAEFNPAMDDMGFGDGFPVQSRNARREELVSTLFDIALAGQGRVMGRAA